MKKVYLFLAFGCVSIILNSCSTSKKQVDKVEEELVWHDNIDKAITISKEENKPLFLFFTGSDWCGWCIRLQKEVFTTPEFKAWAKEKVILVELDFPRKTPQIETIKNQNMQLQQFFAVRGYPTVWFAKGGEPIDGKTSFEQLGSTGYVAGGPTTWLAGADKIIAKFIPYPTTKKTKKAKK